MPNLRGAARCALGALALLSLLPSAQAVQSAGGEERLPNRRVEINFSELAARPAGITIAPRVMHAPMSPVRRPRSTGEPEPVTANPIVAGPVGGPLGPGDAGPELGATFPGLIDNQTVIPPDTHGAVGPNHVMVTLNSEVLIQTRQGSQVKKVALDAFWAELGHAFAFDPKVYWDHFNNRWLFVAMADALSPDSAILIAVSAGPDPTGNWTLFDVSADPSGLTWADYPNIGFNEKWVVFTANMFGVQAPFFDRSEIWVFRQNALSGSGAYKVFSDPNFNFVGAVTHDPGQEVLYLVSEEDDTSLRVSSISGAVGAEVFSSGIAFASSPESWNFNPPEVNFLPQLGTTGKVTANDSRIQNVVFRRGSLWCTHTVFLPGGGQATRAGVQWWQITPAGAVVQRGRIQDPQSKVHYVFPSIGVNGNEDVLIGYSRFAADQFPSANYSARFSGDPANSMGSDVVLKAGEAPYTKDFGSGRVRWGDYSATVVDPLNDIDMWTLQEYAATANNQGDRWGTWWGQLLFGGAPDGVMEVVVTPQHDSVFIAGTSENLFVRISDGTPVTNATVVATVNTGATPIFRNDGAAPDLGAGDGTYSASYSVVNRETNIVMTLVISAPGKVTATNVINYLVVARPTNDNFTNSTKIPVAGGEYITNNRLATTETGEPEHAGVVGVGASLWWSWSPSTSTNVLIDTTGSFADTVVAVYTGTKLSALTPVAATNNVGTRKQAYLVLPVTGGASYRIAVASVSTNNTGKVVLRVIPGGQPDTNAPVVTITSPISGQWLSTNLVQISGIAADPQPWASGINQVFVRVNTRTRTAREVNPGAPISTNWFRPASLREGENTISVTASDLAGNVSDPVSITVTYRVTDPINDLFNNAAGLSGTGGTNSGVNAKATREYGEPLHAGNEGGHSLWWFFKPDADGVLTLSTEGSTFDTLLGLYQGSRVYELTALASNDDATATNTFSRLEQAVRANELYHAAVDGFGGGTGVVRLVHSFQPSAVHSVTVATVGSGTVSPGSGLYGQGRTIRFQATPNFGSFFERWEGDITSAENPLPVTVAGPLNLTAVFAARPVTDGFESGDLTALPWQGAGDRGWVVQTNSVSQGRYAARSGAILDGGTSALKLDIKSRGGEASFDYRVSSEEGWDFLEFYVDGVLRERWSGEEGWVRYPFALSEGDHTLEWRYVKDAFASAGLDAAFLDNVDLPLAPTVLRLLSNGPNGIRVQVLGAPNQVVQIESSTDLLTWQTVAVKVALDSTVSYSDPTPASGARYYRAVIR